MTHLIKKSIALALLAGFSVSSPTFAADTFTPAQKTQIQNIIHEYLLQKPEVLLEAMQVLQRKQYEDAQQTIKQTQKNAAQFAQPLFHQNNDPVSGNPNGKITIVEFFDYQCPHCVDMAPVISAILKNNPDVRVIYKEFPIRGPMSEFASRAALAANKQGKYNEFSHALLTSTKPLTQDTIFAIAKDTGLNVDQLKKDMNGDSVTSQLKMTMDLARSLKLFGTPAFFIGKTAAKDGTITYYPGEMNEKQLQKEIDKAKS
jgi:protein-disulfide isomerase